MGYDVFISYSSKDKAAADAVCAALETNGVRCWIAPRNINPGQDWMEAIIDGIEAARVMVLVFSQHSNNSDQVNREVSHAASGGLTIVPLRLEDVPMNKRLRYLLSTTHWMDALTPPLEKHLRDFSRKVRGMLQLTGHVTRAPDLSTAATQGEQPGTEVDATLSGRKQRDEEKTAPPNPDKVITEVRHKGTNSRRATWNGLGMCEYLRYAGAMGWDKNALAVVAEKLGFKPSPTTIQIQRKAGRDGEKVPSVDKSVADQLAALIADAMIAVPRPAQSISAMPPFAPKSVKEFTDSLGMKFVRIEAGSFLMGSPEDEEGREDNEFQHPVRLAKPFYMATTPVTQKQWKSVMGTDPSYFKGDDLPVETVSWNDAVSFCTRLSGMQGKKYRLPTEAEWEYCCRAGTTTPFNTGEKISTDEANFNGYIAYGDSVKGEYRVRATPVGTFRPNPWELFDMHGNVWEWCADGYGEYEHRDEAQDPKGDETSASRVLRGGSWHSNPRLCRAAFRLRHTPVARDYFIGFRVCLDL